VHEAEFYANSLRPQNSATEDVQPRDAYVAQPSAPSKVVQLPFESGAEAHEGRPNGIAPAAEIQQQGASITAQPSVPSEVFRFSVQGGVGARESRPKPAALSASNKNQGANAGEPSALPEFFSSSLKRGAEAHESRPRPVVQKIPLQAEEPDRSSNSNMTLRILETLEDMSRPFDVSVETHLVLYRLVFSHFVFDLHCSGPITRI